MSKLQIKIEDDGQVMRIAFMGIIDEDVDFSSIPTDSRKEYFFDFEILNSILRF